MPHNRTNRPDRPGPDFDGLFGALASPSSMAGLATHLAQSVGRLDPSSRLIIAERLLAYIANLLVRPLSPARARILDEAGTRMRCTSALPLTGPANDR